MWNLLKKRDEECERLRGLLEGLAAKHPRAGSADKLFEGLPTVQRMHAAACRSCREAAQDLMDAQEIFRVMPRQTVEPGPWFASRVMAAIAAQEKELSEVARTWLAVPKLASRLSLASAALLLVASTWLYERPAAVPSQQAIALAAQESLFETSWPMNVDDVLSNPLENNQ